MPNSVTVNRPITRNRVCTKPGTVHSDAVYRRLITDQQQATTS